MREGSYRLEIRAMQEANKGLSQEEKQALRRAKKAAKKGKQVPADSSPAVAAAPANSASPVSVEPTEAAAEAAVPSESLSKEGSPNAADSL